MPWHDDAEDPGGDDQGGESDDSTGMPPNTFPPSGPSVRRDLDALEFDGLTPEDVPAPAPWPRSPSPVAGSSNDPRAKASAPPAAPQVAAVNPPKTSAEGHAEATHPPRLARLHQAANRRSRQIRSAAVHTHIDDFLFAGDGSEHKAAKIAVINKQLKMKQHPDDDFTHRRAPFPSTRTIST